MSTLALWKFALLQIPAFFSFLCEFSLPEEDGKKKRRGLGPLILIGLGATTWYFLSNTITLTEQAKKDKLLIAELQRSKSTLSIALTQEKASKERKMDRIELLSTYLQDTQGDLEKLHQENIRLYEEIAELKTELTLCQGRTFVCDKYKPSLDIFTELDILTQGGNK